VQITNKLVCWLLDRYFERAVAFLQRHPAAALLKPSRQIQVNTIR
jgi:hypothetical protein